MEYIFFRTALLFWAKVAGTDGNLPWMSWNIAEWHEKLYNIGDAAKSMTRILHKRGLEVTLAGIAAHMLKLLQGLRSFVCGEVPRSDNLKHPLGYYDNLMCYGCIFGVDMDDAFKSVAERNDMDFFMGVEERNDLEIRETVTGAKIMADFKGEISESDCNHIGRWHAEAQRYLWMMSSGFYFWTPDEIN